MRKLLLVLTLVLGVSVTVLAQDGIQLTYGELASGSFDESTSTVLFTFEGEKAQTIYATATAANLEPELRLIGPNGVPIEEADELLGPVTLPDDGQYTLMAIRPDWEDTNGDFNVLVDTTNIVSIKPGTVLEDELATAGSTVFFTYNGNQGDIVSYWAEGSALEIQLQTPGGEDFIAEGGYDMLTQTLNMLPETGFYFGWLQTQNPAGSHYTLAITPVEVIPLTSGTASTGTLASDQEAVFTFTSAADKLWHLSANLGESNTYGGARLEIHQPDVENYWGGALVEDCCSGPNGQPRIDPFTAPADTTYYVILRYEDYVEDGSTIDYEVLLKPSTLVSLAPGSTIVDTISEATGTMIFSYNGTEGEVIRVTLRQLSGEGSPGLLIFSDAWGDVADFRGYVTNAAALEIKLPVDGLYQFEVLNLDYSDTAMEFSLLLETLKE